jgi:hypothetical protein
MVYFEAERRNWVDIANPLVYNNKTYRLPISYDSHLHLHALYNENSPFLPIQKTQESYTHIWRYGFPLWLL